MTPPRYLFHAAAFVAVALALIVPATLPRSMSAASADVTVQVDRSTPDGTSRMDLGVTYMQYTLDSWGDASSVARGKALLKAAVKYHNQHIYGFGTLNPNPAPGSYDWWSLDARIDTIRSMGGTPVITLCCAPDWMTSLSSNTSTYPNIPPTPAHYGDFADLARRIAQRYPDVKHYQVWNEMKGFWKSDINNWDYVEYTKMYNQVYDALKSVDSSIKVGGPYLVIEGTGTNVNSEWATAVPITKRDLEVIDYWLSHKRGADFITVDRGVKDYHDKHQYSREELLSLTNQFGRIAQQIRARTSLPLWWAEDYFERSRDWQFQAVGTASILYHELLNGSSVSLRWEPQSQPNAPYGGNDLNLFSDTQVSGGGQPYPNYDVYKHFHDHFPPGTTLYRVTSSSPEIEALASSATTLLINKRAAAVSVFLNGTLVPLAAYEVKAVPASAATATPSVTATPTVTSTALTPTATSTSTALTPTATSTSVPTSTPTPQPSPTARVTATPSLTPTSATGPCSPRPPIHVSTQRDGTGRLRTTVTASSTTSMPDNRVFSISIMETNNAVIEMAGQPAVSDGFTTTFPSGADSATFNVRQRTSNQGTTVVFSVEDKCGSWKTFVGGGAAAF